MFQFGITVLSLYKLVKIQGKIYSKHRVRIKIKGITQTRTKQRNIT